MPDKKRMFVKTIPGTDEKMFVHVGTEIENSQHVLTIEFELTKPEDVTQKAALYKKWTPKAKHFLRELDDAFGLKGFASADDFQEYSSLHKKYVNPKAPLLSESAVTVLLDHGFAFTEVRFPNPRGADTVKKKPGASFEDRVQSDPVPALDEGALRKELEEMLFKHYPDQGAKNMEVRESFLQILQREVNKVKSAPPPFLPPAG